MLCYNCGASLTEHDFCTNCGAEVGVYKKIMSSANLFYNEGLDRAGVRDLTGAITSLRQCLKMNKNHVDARNLLGLVYFEMGEYVAALSEWVISKNLRPNKNIADDYLNMMQSNPSRLDTINQTIKKYNQALSYCYQGSYDLAIIQLKKVVSLNPKHVQGRQLLALLYLNNEQWEDARKELERCRKIDVNNTTTLRYLKEADAVLDIEEDFNAPPKKKISKETVTYRRGNETIIQPVGGKETKLSSTIVNIVVGIAIGIAVACLLILPARISAAGEESDLKIKEIGEQLDEKNSTINALEQDKNSLTAKVDKLENELATYTGEGGAISSMDNLLNAAMAYLSNPEDTTTVASYLDLIDEGFVDTSTETFREVYGMLRSRIGSTVGGTYFEEGMRAYQNEQFDEAIENLSKAYAYDSSNVDALYNLANAYRKTGDNVNAISNYQTLVDNFPDTELATRSQSFLNELVVD
ncbi:MAG: tetratricopeptide repeat protein [Lachnospiraceae bacterium]|nr:tetratricopeptide repeat protein [Lachnospiraceae bacterium]